MRMRRQDAAAMIKPYHGVAAGVDTYHDRTDCPEGGRIRAEEFRWGEDGRRRCQWCRDHARRRH